MKILFPVFVIATLVEIWVIIKVGAVIGGFSTILLIVLTAAAGSFLLKQQGFATMQNAQKQMQQGVAPAFEMVEGVVIVVSGILLLTPGFITDALGLLGLLPLSRKFIIDRLMQKNKTQIFSSSAKFTKNRKNNITDEEVIDAEFWDEK